MDIEVKKVIKGLLIVLPAWEPRVNLLAGTPTTAETTIEIFIFS